MLDSDEGADVVVVGGRDGSDDDDDAEVAARYDNSNVVSDRSPSTAVKKLKRKKKKAKKLSDDEWRLLQTRGTLDEDLLPRLGPYREEAADGVAGETEKVDVRRGDDKEAPEEAGAASDARKRRRRPRSPTTPTRHHRRRPHDQSQSPSLPREIDSQRPASSRAADADPAASSADRNHRKKKPKKRKSKLREGDGDEPESGGRLGGNKARKASADRTPPAVSGGAEIGDDDVNNNDDDDDNDDARVEWRLAEIPGDNERRGFSDESGSLAADTSLERGGDTVMFLSMQGARPAPQSGFALPPAVNRFATKAQRRIRTWSSGNKISPAVTGSADGVSQHSGAPGRIAAGRQRWSSMSDLDDEALGVDRDGEGGGGGGSGGRILDQSPGSGVSDDVFIASFRGAGGGSGGGKKRDITSGSSVNVELNDPFTRGPVQASRRVEPLAGPEGDGMKKSESMEVLNLTLHQCARDGDEYNMKILLRHMGSHLKKRINQYDEDDLTPLHYAARYNFLGVVKLLVENGADVDRRGEDEVTPLHHAARYRREKNKKKDASSSEPNELLEPGTKGLALPTLDSGSEGDAEADADANEQNPESVLQEMIAEKAEIFAETAAQLSAENSELFGEDAAAFIAGHVGQTTDEKPSEGLQGIPLLDQYESEFGQTQESVIDYLISKGADINSRDVYGQTPLHFAAMRGNEIAAKDLLQIPSVDIEAQDKQGISPLHMAALHNQLEVARLLIEAGANLRCMDAEQCTPLHHAASEGNVDMVQDLFDAGAKTPEAWVMISNMVSDQNIEGSTCLHVAVDNGHYEVAKMCLEKRAEVNKPCYHYMYPLHLAATSGDIRIVELLVENSARIDVVNDEQATALHKAAALNHAKVVRYLAEKGARINRRDKDNYTPMLLAATYGHVETVELLLQKGADYTAVDKYDRTAIYMAAEENKLPVLEKLLSYPQVKRLINVSEQYDATPLHIAAQQGNLDIVKVLLSHGANLDSKNEEEQSAIHLAAKFGRTNIVREIVRTDKSVLHHEDEDSNTALHLAAQFGHFKVVEVLLDLGSDVSARNYNQWTPLDLAASKGHTKTCSILLENDAPVDPTDKNSTTPLHLAARFGHPTAVKLLLDWDADITLEDSEGRNCLDIAIENSHPDVAMGIINSDVWQEALRNSTEDPETGRMDTPMRKLIKRMPDVAERVFDRCLNFGQEKNPEKPSFEVTFNYEFLDDAYMPWISAKYRKSLRDDASSMSDTSSVGSAFDDDDNLLPTAKPYSSDSNYVKKNSPLFIMMSSEREVLMDHPLVTSLLKHKWSTFGRVFYYLSLFIYCIFLTFLTGYIVNTPPPQSFNASDRDKIEDGDCNNLSQTYSKGLFTEIGTYVVIALAAFNLCKEILQMYQAKLSYLGWINLIEWLTYVSALLLVINFNSCQQSTGYRYEWQWQLGAASVFLAWINLVLFIQKFPQLGIYVVMFADVLYTFAQFFVVFFLFIIAFAMAFFAVLQQQDPFSTVSKSLIKTSVMMIGEFDFDTIFNDSSNNIYYSAVSYIIFIAFLVVMSILLMNLLVGLAVDDIKAVLDKAALKRMAMQVELALDVERVIPAFLRRKAFAKRKTIRPNRRFSNPIANFFFTRTDVTTKELQQHLNYELNEMEKVKEGQDKLTTDVKKLERSVIILRESSQRVESMLKVVLRASNIDWEDEDYQEEDEVEQLESGLNY